MTPHARLWIACFAALGLGAQEPAYFKEEPAAWWKPTGELRLLGDRLRVDGYPSAGFDRGGARLLLRWEPAWAWGRFVLGTRHQVASDPNRLNPERYDQERSNDHRVKLAFLTVEARDERGHAELRVGLQDNPMLTQESLWDRDLSLLGLGLSAGSRVAALGIEEVGVWGVAGRVQTVPGARVDLFAAQGVLKGEVGPVAWTLHGGRWDVRWDGDAHRLRPLPGSLPGLRQRMTFDVVGVGIRLDGPVPVESRWISHRNRHSREDGEELQLFVGSRSRTWWPQVGYVWQRYEPTGTPYPVNGDDWWYVSNAKGPRWLLALPLPRRLLFQASLLRHHWRDVPITRAQVGVTWRFGRLP
jgi:hypothetical protein